jgi:hypothetical protein
MDRDARNGVLGLALVGLGAGLAAAGMTLLIPVLTSWGRARVADIYSKGRESAIRSLEKAAETLGHITAKAQQPLSDAARAAKHTTAVAAGAIESAAHYIRERVEVEKDRVERVQ